MHIEVRQAMEVMILDLKGRLTAGLGDQILRDAIDELLAEGRRRILLNLSEVSFLDSAGVGELVAGLKTSRRFQAELKLLNVGERVYSTLDMARLLPTFEIYGDEAEAVVDPVSGEGVAELTGEVVMEFAYLDWVARPWLGVRTGKVLVPMGIVNEQHEPPTYFAARRPDTERFIVPSTWASVGAGAS